MPKVFKFFLSNAVCINCILPAERALLASNKIKVTKAVGDGVTKEITIEVEATGSSDQEIRAALCEILADDMSLGPIEILEKTEQEDQTQVEIAKQQKEEIEKKKRRRQIILGIIGLALGVAFLLLSVFSGGIPLLALFIIGIVGSVIAFILGLPTYIEAIKKLIKAKTLTMDVLFSIGSLAAIGVTLAALFVPGLCFMLDAAFLIFGFRYIGKLIEDAAKNKVMSDITFRDRAPKQIIRVRQQGDDEVSELADVADLQEGDIITVRTGEVVPVNGECLTEASLVYDTILTGGILPRRIMRDGKILAGMRVSEDAQPIRMRVTAKESQSFLAKLDKEIAQAHLEKAPLETTAAKALRFFIPTVLVIALVAGICLGIFFPPLIAVQCVIGIVVAACPCTLGLIVPLTIKVGISKAAEHGVRFKSGKALQAAAQIDTVVFDLNGTLTSGAWRVDQLNVLDSALTEDEVLDYLCAIEAHSKHAAATAIIDYKRVRPSALVATRLTVTDVDKSDHAGIKAKIDGRSFVVGNRAMMQASGIDVSHIRSVQKGLRQQIFIACEGRVIGCVVLRDSLRPGAKATIQALQRDNKQVHLCTGADKQTAQYYAHMLGIAPDCVKAECVPGEEEDGAEKRNSKLQYIRSLQQQGHKVAMVGDSGNDSVSAAKSDLGIAVRSSSSDEMTQQNAGAILEGNSLRPVLTTFAVAKDTVSNIKQNLIFSLTYNMTMMLIAGGILILVGFMLNPGIGAALMILQIALILVNVYRLKKGKMPHLENAAAEDAEEQEETEVVESYVLAGERLDCAAGIQEVQSPSEVQLPAVDQVSLEAAALPATIAMRAPVVDAALQLAAPIADEVFVRRSSYSS